MKGPPRSKAEAWKPLKVLLANLEPDVYRGNGRKLTLFGKEQVRAWIGEPIA